MTDVPLLVPCTLPALPLTFAVQARSQRCQSTDGRALPDFNFEGSDPGDAFEDDGK